MFKPCWFAPKTSGNAAETRSGGGWIKRMRNVGPINHAARGRLLWGGLTVVCVLGLLFARVSEDRAYDREVEAATARAQTATNEVVGRHVRQTPGTSQLRFLRTELTIALQAEVFTDPSAARVRLFGPDASLLFATDTGIGTTLATDDPAVLAALEGKGSTRTAREPFTLATTGERGPDTDLQQVFVPLYLADRAGTAGATEIDFLSDELRAMAAGPWPAVQLVLGIALLVCLGMAVVTWIPLRRREPKGSIADTDVDGEREAEVASGAVAPVLEEENVDTTGAELDELRSRLQATEEALREAEADRTLLETASKSETAFEERIAHLEARLAEAEVAAGEARATLVAAESAEQPEAPVEPVEEAPSPAAVDDVHVDRRPSDLLDELVHRVEIAEERTREAEERLAAAGTVVPSHEASELRARLARAAARKKLGNDAEK